MSKTWKEWEREVAERLGAKRIVRANYGESAPDFESDWLVGDAKVRERLPQWITSALDRLRPFAGEKKLPIVVLREKGNKQRAWVLMALDDFCDFFIS